MKIAIIKGFAALCLLTACASWRLPYELQYVPAAAETEPMTGVGDRADDPAIWVHPSDASLSLILGTNKQEGLYVYSLEGIELQRLSVGRVNNVDVRGDLAVASNDEVNGLSWFQISHDASGAVVEHLGDTPVQRIEPYGICLGLAGSDPVAGVTYKDGALELWRGEFGSATPTSTLERTVKLGSQLEGCVFDDAERRLFIGEENHGVWSLDLADPESVPLEVDSIAAGNGLVADVEGISLYLQENGGGYLVVSAQEADRYVLYERQPPHAVVGGFRIAASNDGTVDRVSHTDGLDVSSAALPGYPHGLLVVQDDANPRAEQDQNFKLVDWREVEKSISSPSR